MSRISQLRTLFGSSKSTPDLRVAPAPQPPSPGTERTDPVQLDPAPKELADAAAFIGELWAQATVSYAPKHSSVPPAIATSLWLDDRSSLAENREALSQRVVTVVGTPSESGNGALLTDADHVLSLIGRRPAFVGSFHDTTVVAIFEGDQVPSLVKASADFQVTAVITAYNERDVLIPTVRRLIDDGIHVHLLDNWSNDGSAELIRETFPDAPIEIEQFPPVETGKYDWEALLGRVEEVGAASSSDWIIHHDADEIREGPWAGWGLRDSLYNVQLRGFDCIDHTVIDFRPMDDRFVEGHDPKDDFSHFDFGHRPGHFLQIKAWRNQQKVNLRETGGHRATFDQQHPFPYKFLLRHYPIRSQEHGERKVLRDRQPRWNAVERERGWHTQYDQIQTDTTFQWQEAELISFEYFDQQFLLERLTGVGIPRA